jgi:hypothetical protein
MVAIWQLSQAADRIAAAVPIAKAIVDGRQAEKRMSLAEKMKTLASRSQAVPGAIERRVDALLPRIDALEANAGVSLTGLEQVVADAEAGVAATDAAMRQLSNGGPPLGSSENSSGT